MSKEKFVCFNPDKGSHRGHLGSFRLYSSNFTSATLVFKINSPIILKKYFFVDIKGKIKSCLSVRCYGNKSSR